MTRFLNISTDNTLGGLSPSDEFVASQKAIKEYVDNNSSNVQVDNLTITTNASDEIQTIAAINQNSGILKFWKGTKTEYENLPSHDPNTQYTVTGDNTAGMMPTGSIIPFAGTTVPDGYLLCDGSAISRTTYADLFAVIGTVYGTGDGSTTFNIPNLKDRTVRGDWGTGNTGYTTTGELPNIYGHIGNLNLKNLTGNSFYNGALSYAGFQHEWSGFNQTTETCIGNITFDAHNSKTAYVRNDNMVIPSSVVMYWCIKY